MYVGATTKRSLGRFFLFLDLEHHSDALRSSPIAVPAPLVNPQAAARPKRPGPEAPPTGKGQKRMPERERQRV